VNVFPEIGRSQIDTASVLRFLTYSEQPVAPRSEVHSKVGVVSIIGEASGVNVGADAAMVSIENETG